MNILLVGKSETGKTNLGDIIRNAVFKVDGNSTVMTDDPDREKKVLGHGSNIYNISVKQLKVDETLSSVEKEVLDKQDVVVYLGDDEFLKWFRTIYSK